MALDKIRNHMKNICHIMNLVDTKEDFYDVKNQIMDLVCEVIPCEKVALNILSNQDEKEVYLVYSNNTDELLEGHQKNSVTVNSQKIFRLPAEGYSDFIWNAVKSGQIAYEDDFTHKNRKKAVFPIKNEDKTVGFVYFLFAEGYTLGEDDRSFLMQVMLLLAGSLALTNLKKRIMELKMREREMAMAFDMQQNIMSDNHIHFFHGGKISYLYKYGEAMDYLPYLSKRLGGDYCEIVPFGQAGALVFIADVMGHGMASNYFVSMMKGILKTCIHVGTTEPDDLLNHMNSLLMKELDKANLFVTAQAVYIDFEKQFVKISNAGHTEPILFSHKEDIFWYSYISEEKGLPLGIDESIKYACRKIDVNEYDTLLLYTDGIVEATDIEGKEYGTEGILNFCKENGRMDSEVLIDGLYHDVIQFSKDTDGTIQDDIMIVAVQLDMEN